MTLTHNGMTVPVLPPTPKDSLPVQVINTMTDEESTFLSHTKQDVQKKKKKIAPNNKILQPNPNFPSLFPKNIGPHKMSALDKEGCLI